jgi:hypothetical protein
MRINTPQKNLVKLEQVLLYLLSEIGGYCNVDLDSIFALMYFIDFDFYELNESQLVGLEYIKTPSGMESIDFKKLVAKMVLEQKLEIVPFENKFKLLPLIKADLKVLNGTELIAIKSVIARYGLKSFSQLNELICSDTPYRVAKVGLPLEYEHAFYRQDRFSVREYEVL